MYTSHANIKPAGRKCANVASMTIISRRHNWVHLHLFRPLLADNAARDVSLSAQIQVAKASYLSVNACFTQIFLILIYALMSPIP